MLELVNGKQIVLLFICILAKNKTMNDEDEEEKKNCLICSVGIFSLYVS